MDETRNETPEAVGVVVVELGDAAELTLGQGQAQNENKRNPYN
ncbi:albusnodin family lasso peptide [Nocardiopsis quinghaiensis]|nr:albusnodin family lasso peptide [Nocardiopsis quinghaiensis]